MTSVYVLIDPRGDEPRYVGRSEFPARRLMTHLQGGSKATRQWIMALRDAGMSPRMRIVRVCRNSIASRAESREIVRLTKLSPGRLLNSTLDQLPAFSGFQHEINPGVELPVSAYRDRGARRHAFLRRLKEIACLRAGTP